jgi:hypothetical protein
VNRQDAKAAKDNSSRKQTSCFPVFFINNFRLGALGVLAVNPK